MRNVAAAPTYLGTILLAFGLVITVIQLLANRYGSGHPTGEILGIGLLVAGAAAAGTGHFIRRSRSTTSSRS